MNANSPNSSFAVTVDDLRAYDWQAVVQTAIRRECYSYYEVFTDKTKALSQVGDDRGTRIFRFLTAVASFWPNYDSNTEPYRPMAVDYQTGKRTIVPEDLAQSDLDVLHGILDETKDSEFRARIADVLWVSRKDYIAAQKAVDAYIESSRNLDSGDMWPPFTERLQRAMQVGAQLGRLKPYHQKAIQAVEDTISRHSATDDGLLCARLMHLLLSDEVGDSKKYAPLSETLAKRMESIPNWHFAREYWAIKASWSSDEKDVRDSQLEMANTYVKLAESFATGHKASFLSASHWMGKAVEALRQARADPKEIENTHRRFLDFQRRSMKEMETVQIPLDNSPGLQQAMEQAIKDSAAHVAEPCFEDAILRLAFITQPTQPNELRKRIEDPNSGGVFTQLYGSSTVRPAGQVSDTKPPIASSDPKEREEAVSKEMYSQARIVDWPLRVRVHIEPARQMIIAKHPARRTDLVFLVHHNPFVPRGREGLFLRGLQAGLHGDLVLALHLLLPQIENSIREIFTARGIITSKLESDETQDERDLGWLLTHPEMAKIFTEGVAFDLRGLLVERFGLNLRNDLAHGLLAESQIVSEGALYVWWLALRLCCIPIAIAKQEELAS